MRKELQVYTEERPVSSPVESDTRKVLRHARDLLSAGWIAWIRESHDTDGVRYCALGALDVAMGGGNGQLVCDRSPAVALLSRLISADAKAEIDKQWAWSRASLKDNAYVAQYNNTQGKEKTLELFDRAIEIA